MTGRILASWLAIALAAAGCATVAREHTAEREAMLVQAGFEKRLATRDAQKEQLVALPARKVVRVPRGGEVAYVYADPDGCQCLYVGDRADWERFLQAVTRELIDNDYADTATPDPVLGEREMEAYEQRAREAVLDPDASASLDWSLWD